MIRTIAACIVSLSLLAACSDGENKAPAEAPDKAAITDNNKGVGLMYRFEYGEAESVFADLAAQYPDWLDVTVNLAIATLNRQEPGDEETALTLVTEVLQDDPRHLRAHYVAGLLKLYLGRTGEALEHFRAVVEGDPADAYAAYHLAQCYAQQGEYGQALPWYERARELDPYLRSAYYGAFQSLQRLGRDEEATAMAAEFQRLDRNPRSRVAEFMYTRMGPRGEAQVIDLDTALATEAATAPASAAPPPRKPEGALFEAPEPLPISSATPLAWHDAPATRGPSLTTVDLQNDGMPDLFLAGALGDADGGGAANLVLEGQADGGYLAATSHPLAGISAVNAALWGDFDNDGLVDVYLCRRGANQLWRQTATDTWEDVTAATGTAGADLDTVDGAFFDADHDGDLDLYLVNADGPDELLNNNLDGSFRPLAAEYDLAGGDRASALVVPADLDSDRDVDLIVISQAPPHRVYINDRLWSYHEAPGWALFTERAALAALAADLDADGFSELYTISAGGELLRWQADAAGEMTPEILGTPEVLAGATRAQLASHDVNGDGLVDLIVASPKGWAALAPAADGFIPLYSASAAPDAPHAAHLPFIGTSLEGPGMLVYAAADHGLSLWRPGPGRYPFITLSLSGRQDDAQSMRSNASGLGVELSVRVDSRWTRLHTYRNNSGPGQSLQPLAVGLKGAGEADFIAINWPDGVLQSEVNIASGKLETVTETQRQLSSCPVLFAWNGREYVFVSDILGVAALGYAIGHGEYAPPRPWENFLLPEGLLQPRDGRYEIKISEPMEENGYIDAVRLISYDLPPGWQMVLDERMNIAGPEPTGRPLLYRRELLPDSAVNDRGSQVLETVLAKDGKAAPAGTLDTRFIGRLQDEHVLTLTFPETLDSHPGQAVLVIDGWVEYPYSQTAFAASQAGAAFEAPSLDAAADDGRWQPVAGQFGYPAGMPRRMALPLPALPEGTRSLRLRTNMQVYWDRIAVAFAETPPSHTRQQLKLAAATLKKTGFARRDTFEQFRPHYDYASRSPFLDTRYMAGNYSRFGPVDELVSTLDDAVAIFGPGEEVHAEFDAAGPPPDGWRRVFVLETHGWAKDMDLFTLDGETVGPLPNTGKAAAVRQALHARYNTRYRAGY